MNDLNLVFLNQEHVHSLRSVSMALSCCLVLVQKVPCQIRLLRIPGCLLYTSLSFKKFRYLCFQTWQTRCEENQNVLSGIFPGCPDVTIWKSFWKLVFALSMTFKTHVFSRLIALMTAIWSALWRSTCVGFSFDATFDQFVRRLLKMTNCRQRLKSDLNFLGAWVLLKLSGNVGVMAPRHKCLWKIDQHSTAVQRVGYLTFHNQFSFVGSAWWSWSIDS